TLLGRVYGEAREMIWPENRQLISDKNLRTEKINEDILKYSIVNAVTGAFPLPVFSIATDMLVISMQAKMVHDIGNYWGHKVDKQAVRSLIGSILGATSMRIAIHNMLIVLPVFGSIFGAMSA